MPERSIEKFVLGFDRRAQLFNKKCNLKFNVTRVDRLYSNARFRHLKDELAVQKRILEDFTPHRGRRLPVELNSDGHSVNAARRAEVDNLRLRDRAVRHNREIPAP